jgi:phosphoribosyl 1,2-cyclic phosphodiesterase
VRFASLGSGSEGNALIVQTREGGTTTTIMIDCGFNQKELERRLNRVGLSTPDLDAIFVTHEHSDHIGGVFRVGRKFDIPLYMTRGTYINHNDALAELASVQIICAYTPVVFQDLSVMPFTVPHDAREPVQYVVQDRHARLGALTDLGHLTPSLYQDLAGLNALVLEANHDSDMLERSSYPASLKRRIAGPYGHLANDVAATLLAGLDRSQLQTILAAHLSSSNNTPDLAREHLSAACGRPPSEIGVALQDEGFDWIELQ